MTQIRGYPQSPPIPTENELLLHVLHQCSNLQSFMFHGEDSTEADVRCWSDIVTTTAVGKAGGGTVMDLEVEISSDHYLADSRILPMLFQESPRGLRRLKIHVSGRGYLRWHYTPARMAISRNLHQEVDLGTDKDEESDTGPKQEPLLELKDLSVTCIYGDSYPPSWAPFLSRCVNLTNLCVTTVEQSWILRLRACVHLRSLQIHEVCLADLRVFINALKPSKTTDTSVFPRLHSIRIDKFGVGLNEGRGEEVAEMLRSYQTRWRSVNLSCLSPLAVEALIEHCRTLEHLVIRRCRGLTSASMQKILSSSPRLVTFSTLESDTCKFRESTHITAKDFIDLDLSSPLASVCADSSTLGSSALSQIRLKHWQCESTLKVFRAKITDIPRPDVCPLYHMSPLPFTIPEEAYPGQGHDLHRRIYERLARFTNSSNSN